MRFTFFTDRDLGRRFPDALRKAGLTVHCHSDHFAPQTPDSEWLAAVGERGWIALTHNQRIRYTPNELRAVMKYRVGLIVIVGKAPLPDLAESFVNTIPQLERFLAKHTPPFVAKLYRPSPAELGRHRNAPGRVDLWYP